MVVNALTGIQSARKQHQQVSEKFMSYVIIGFGKIGQALAHAFARNNIDVTVASRRPPEELASIVWVYPVATNTKGHLVAAQKDKSL